MGPQLAAACRSPPRDIGEDPPLGIHGGNAARSSMNCQLLQIINVNQRWPLSIDRQPIDSEIVNGPAS
jgi:hypothetical protein